MTRAGIESTLRLLLPDHDLLAPPLTPTPETIDPY